MFHSNILLSDNDKLRAKEANVILFDEQDLSYYETLVTHLGAAAKTNFSLICYPAKKCLIGDLCSCYSIYMR